MISRNAARVGYDEATRISLLETDVDKLDSDIFGLKAQISKLTWSLAGAAITMGTTSILFAANLIIHANA